MEAGGTFFAFRAGDVGCIFPACRYRGIRGCPLTSVKRNAFYESGKNCTQGFGSGWERQPESVGYGYGSQIRAGENGVRLRGQAGEISMYRCGYWESGCGTVRDWWRRL